MDPKITNYFLPTKTFINDFSKSRNNLSMKRPFKDLTNNKAVNGDHSNGEFEDAFISSYMSVTKKIRNQNKENIGLPKFQTTAKKENIQQSKPHHQLSLDRHFIVHKKALHCDLVLTGAQNNELKSPQKPPSTCVNKKALPSPHEEASSDDESIEAVAQHLVVDPNQLSEFSRRLSPFVVLVANLHMMMAKQINTPASASIARTAILDSKIYTKPLRVWDSPREEYIIQPVTLQFKSNYRLKSSRQSTSVAKSNKEDLTSTKPLHPAIQEYQSIAHFHNLRMEKLESHVVPEFMPQHREITGEILSHFVNEIFKFQDMMDFDVELAHHATDNLYMYLSRLDNVNIDDLKLATLGAIYTAGTTHNIWIRGRGGSNLVTALSEFSGHTSQTIFESQMRLVGVLDFEVNRLSVIHYRNQYLKMIEERDPERAKLLNQVSGFVLDMICHNYNTMRVPTSKRAAAAVWLGRVIVAHKFHDNRFDSESLWPEAVTDKSGHSATEMQQLGLHMHTIVLSLLHHHHVTKMGHRGSIHACYDRHSFDELGDLSNRYTTMATDAVESWMTFPDRGADWLNDNDDHSTSSDMTDPVSSDDDCSREGSSATPRPKLQ